MRNKANKTVFNSIAFLGGLFTILFLTTLIPSVYFQIGGEMEVGFWILRALLIAITPVLFLPIIYWISIKKPVLRNWKNLLLHVVLSVLFCFVFLLFIQLVLFYLYEGKFFFSLTLDDITSILTRRFFSVGSILFFGYWGIVVLLGLKKYYEDVDEMQRKANEIQSQLEEATFSSLQAQLKPHFLFNTLSMVDQLIFKNPKQAIEMVDRLEKLLRNMFDRNNSENCTISEEIDFLKKYLSIEESRFRDRLTVQYSVSEATKNIMIPRYLLQPLVENALKHGVSQTINKSVILIKSEFLADKLVLSIENNIPNKISRQNFKKNGIGLKNVENRLSLYFGKDAKLKVTTSKMKVFTCRILIPKNYLWLKSGSKIMKNSAHHGYQSKYL